MTLAVTYEGHEVGTIEATDGGLRLAYAPTWRANDKTFPISLSLPMAAPIHEAATVTPWLMNLLPEGDPLQAMMSTLGVAQGDVLGLIAKTGRDLAGALIIGEGRGEDSPDYLIAPPTDLERIIHELPAKPFLIGDEGVSMSLAGAQEKLPVAVVDGRIAIPVRGAVSTHILKPDNPRLPGSVLNEAFCMRLAQRCGLAVAPVTTGVAGSRSYLLVERYDRRILKTRVERLHQEDFCQALGRPPVAKYEQNSSGFVGPSLQEMFHLVRATMTATSITRLLDAVIFNIAIGNVDSHAKNYSILLAPKSVQLAPLYDLLSGSVWPTITRNHAQFVGGERLGLRLRKHHWLSFAADCGLAKAGTVRRVQEVIGRLIEQIAAAKAEVEAMPAGGGLDLETVATAVSERAHQVLANLTSAEDG